MTLNKLDGRLNGKIVKIQFWRPIQVLTNRVIEL